MKQTMKYLSMAALVVMGAVVVSCSKKEIDQPNEETTEVVEPAAEDNIVVCTTTVSFDTDGTKALDEDGVKTFAPGEKIAVIYKNTSDETAKAESTELTAGDITNGGKSATFHVSLTNPGTAAAVRIIYPAAMAASTVDTDTEVDADATINYAALNSQDGTLATLSSNLDLAVYDGNLVGTDLPEDPAIHNKLAICLYTIKDNATPTANDLTSTITGMTISDGTYNYSVSRSAAAGPIYVAIRPTSDATINYTATDGTNYFKKTVTGKTYVASQMYPLGLRMADYDGVDLSALGADYVAQHGDVLTGELTRSCKISIADGATVTLKGVNITNLGKGCFYAGITCLGDATILLSGSNQLMGGIDDGSQGVGDGYGIWPGIFVPSGKTLTVDGTGSLDVRSNGVYEYTKYAPGIGGDWNNGCGNIIIQGGSVTATGGISSAGIGGGGNITITGSANVTATGGMDGPGIGSGNGDTCGDITISTTGTVTAQGGATAAGIGSGTGGYIPSHCGNILISEGTIVATGGYLAAGIGSGFQSTCGTITIENTVTSVTATRGEDAYDCIGCGDSGTCGTVKFGDQTMFDGSWWTTTPTDGGIYGGLSLAITTTTNTNDTWTLTPYVAPAVPTGAINGLFTINDSGDQVYFSQGNLQAVGTTSSSPSSGWTWQFAEHQYDYIGSAAANTSINGSGSVSVAGTVDLFGWVGTSSDNNNYGIWNNTTANDYGDTKNESLKNDWGHNAITNGGNTADMWRTLTREEWGYMLSTRSGATVNGSNNVRFAKATIRTDATGVKGLLLFPDGATFDASEASWGELNDGYENYTTTCTAAQWTALEAKGCVFLPAAGNRTGTTVSDAGDAGAYWTATGSDSKVSDTYPYSYRVYFGQTSWGNPQYYSQQQKTYGHSVRLVKDVN